MSKAIQCDRCGKAESVGMSETFNGPFRDALRSGYYLNQLDFCSQCATAFLALLRVWLSEREP